MHKLKLDLDALAVESFDTRPGSPRPRGTVAGHADAFAAYANQNGRLSVYENDPDWSLVTDCVSIADPTCRSCAPCTPPPPPTTIVVTAQTCVTGCLENCGTIA